VRVAVVDIGSNTIRLLITDNDGRELARDVTVTGLGSGIERTGRFDRHAYEATVSAAARYRSVIATHAVSTIDAVATSASRDAGNGTALMDDIERVLGVRPTIIDGASEAALAFSGATEGQPDRAKKLVIDVGGGSTEFVFGTTDPLYTTSIDMGSVRLTDRCVLERPVRASTIEIARTECDAAFAAVSLPEIPDRSLGVAGTFTNLSAIAMHLEVYDRAVVHGSLLSVASVGELVDRLAGLTIEQTEAIPSLDPARAKVMFAGAVIVERAMIRCGIDPITISEHDLLDGLAANARGR